MGEKKLETIGVVEGVTWNTLPLVMTDSYFLKNVVTWSKRTFVRRVQEEGFPAFKDGTHYCIYRDHAIKWLKRREANGT